MGRLRSRVREGFPKLAGFGPYILAVAYHNAMEAVLTALERVDGDLSEDQGRFRSALAALELEAPQGHIRLDENRRAVGPNYLHKVETRKVDFGVTTFRSVPNVEQTFGGYFKPGAPTPAATSPPCTQGIPSWAGAESAGAQKDQVKRVRFSGGARPPGRRPLRTSSVG